MRIDKFISSLGVASRKESAREARRGGVLVNGIPAYDLSCHIDPERDSVSYLGRALEYNKYIYVMLNKPEGYVSATDDKNHPFVTELLPDELRRRELFPVGRLDKDTTGLMLLTNNGRLAHSLLSPKHHVKKEYYFTAREPLIPECEEIFLKGAVLADGYECKSAHLCAEQGRMGGVITLVEGKYHQIKRMLGAVGNRVVTLRRIKFADIPLDPSLSPGEWRYLTEDEIGLLTANEKE